jgi:outer membrane protein W
LTRLVDVYAQEDNYSLSLKFSYTTSSKIFLNPNSADLLIRGKYLSIDNIYGGGIELRRKINDTQIQVGLSVDYISKLEDVQRTNSKDGFWAIPIELTGYFYIPIVEGDLKIFLGGGGGYYIGERTYYISQTKTQVLERSPGAGIHIIGGVDYFFYNRLGIRSQMKFRDVQFKTTSRINNQNTSDLKSQTNIDGMTIELGLVYSI